MIFKSIFFHEIEKLKYFWNLSRIFNWTALTYATLNDYKEIVEILIRQKDIDINMKGIINQKHSSYSKLSFFMELKSMFFSGI